MTKENASETLEIFLNLYLIKNIEIKIKIKNNQNIC